MYRCSIGGKRICEYAKTLAELREKEAALQNDLYVGIDYRRGTLTVTELLEEHIRQKRNVRLRTKHQYQNVLRLIKLDPIGAMKIRNVKTMDAKHWAQRLQDSGKSYGTVRTVRGVLLEAFDHAVEDDAVRKNPFRFKLKDVLDSDEREVQPLPKEVQIRFFDFILGDNTYRKYHNVYMLLLDTGMRISELCGLTFADVDLEERVIHITHQLIEPQREGEVFHIDSPKTESGVRDIPIRDRAYMALQGIIAARPMLTVEPMIDGYSGFLFIGNSGQPKRPSSYLLTLYRIVNKYNRTHQMQMPHITPHMFRHTFCTELITEGVDIKTVQYVMGHSTPQVALGTYAHVNADTVKDNLFKYSSDTKFTPILHQDTVDIRGNA